MGIFEVGSEEGEIRRSGFVFLVSRGYTERVKSCQTCAKTLGLVWSADFFEGQCTGCEATLSGFPLDGVECRA